MQQQLKEQEFRTNLIHLLPNVEYTLNFDPLFFWENKIK